MVEIPYPKPLSIAIEELYQTKVKIVGDDEQSEEDNNSSY